MRILGIDPGSRITGFGVIDMQGSRYHYVGSGCIRTRTNDFPQRLKIIFQGVREVMEEYRPGELAVEQVFVKHNVSSALKLGQARGAAICAAMLDELQASEYTPTQVKQAIVGTGRASKDQVQHMVAALLKLPGLPQEDAADALAIALCHAQLRGNQQRLQQALRGTS